MCGICGVVGTYDAAPVDPAVIERMNRTMTPRGPDQEGTYVSGAVGLGSRRLSIIDVEGGRQPISNEDRTTWIVFNGEIYNYRELRPYLEQRGHQFATHTDTEVILHLYEELGTDCLLQLDGIFAFAIWDSRARRLV